MTFINDIISARIFKKHMCLYSIKMLSYLWNLLGYENESKENESDEKNTSQQQEGEWNIMIDEHDDMKKVINDSPLITFIDYDKSTKTKKKKHKKK